MLRAVADIQGEKSQERILGVATRLFGRKGYHATTIDNITRAAGVSRGALYWHFESKSHLLGAVVERLKKEYMDRFMEETMAAGPKAIDRLLYVFKFNARFAVENTDLVHCLRTLSLELSPNEDVQARAFFNILELQRNFLANLLREAQAEGDVRADLDAELLALTVLAVHDGILLQWIICQDFVEGRELAWAFRQVMLAGMAPGARMIHGGKRPEKLEKGKAK